MSCISFKKRFEICIISLAFILLSTFNNAWSADTRQQSKQPQYEFQKGMCYVTWSKGKYASTESDASLKELSRLKTTWVAIIPTWYQEKCSSSSISFTKDTPTDDSIVHVIEKAHSLGLKVMLKPHLDISDRSEGGWRGEISCTTEPDWVAWFDDYKKFILHYAKIAEANKVEMLCIGTELTSAATTREKFWKEVIIKPVREIYKGPLTYAANWNEEYQHVKFWDVLDYVGIDAYFPLSDKNRPTLKEIKDGWVKWVEEIEEFQKRVNKPIIFPEAGYVSAEGATKAPWEEIPGGKLSLELQADCYQALFETFWNKEWFYGVYWWKWGTDIRFGGPSNLGFNPQGKPASHIVSRWYKKSGPVRRWK